MRIRAAKGGLAVEPNVVYLRPAQQTLIIEQGLLVLKQRGAWSIPAVLANISIT